jgi:opacity protein-like surface antigen
MKTLISAVLTMLLFFVSVTSSQINQPAPFDTYLKAGKCAVQFELGTFINPTYFQAIELSFKPQISRTSAVRLGVGFDLTDRSGDRRQEGVTKPENEKSTSLSASLNYLYYVNPKDRVCFFLGIGPVYEYKEYKNSYTETTQYGSMSSYQYDNSERRWNAGGRLIFGTEWFIHERISILAEYNMEFKMGKLFIASTQKYTSPYSPAEIHVRNQDSDLTEFQFNIVKIGLTAYF